jgi:glutamate dehydrogenase
MKTQKVKNALIVPSGAKGGFIVRDLPEDRDAARFAVERAYKDFIISLLSVSDNQVGGETVRPRDLVIYDEEDTYFVVAADKGTATYSDMANGIAENFQFWLKDAFASGGSNGYDHKLYGITAKGAWVCVERHFKNIRLDHEKVSFTAVGIGDMSGDVFGNGLLLSKTIKLLAAFNHKHIFIDPDPDPQRSFEERTRLFETPGTQWSDYSEDRMSAGGGIYGRFDKEITLSPQARTALGISDDVPQVLNGEQIIALILKAPVDLLWNGGIGTYVKSKFESHSDVNDGTNDRVRVKAHELRCKIVGEGGNLGFTQRARIEFAQAGGCINTDAIDNSGGVDLSDHEVNLKILFERIIEDKRLTLEKRNELLKEIASEVVSLVLENNRQHALLLTVGIERSKRNIEYFRSLIRDITKMGYIDRTIENLPEDEELIERAIRREGLCAPELAVCVAAVKLWTKEVLLETEWLDTPLLESYLLEYFPERIRKLYPQDILAHPLRRHIVATQLTNSLVNAIGITFIHRMCLSYSVGVDTVVKCALAAEMLLKTPALREEFRERFDNFEDMPRYLNLTLELNDSLREATAWLLRTHAHRLSLAELVDRYQQQFETLIASAGDLFVGEAKEIYQLRLGKYTEEGLSEHAASSMAAFPRIMSLLEMLWTARQSSQEVDTVAHTFSLVMQELQVHSLLAMENSIEPQDKWQNELLVLTYDEIRRSISNITLQLLKAEESDPEVFVELLRRSETYEPLMSMIAEVKEKSPSVAAISVLSRHLGNFEIRP